MNKDLKILMLKQACEDIKANAEDIVGSTKYDKNLSVEISFYEDESPVITVNKEFLITFSKEIENCILEKGWN